MAVMGRRKLDRRTPLQAGADRAASALAQKLGLMLKDGRRRMSLTQEQASGRAGMSRGRWGDLETGRDAGGPLATWSRAAFAVGGSLDAWIKQTSAAGQPKDAVHLRHQELIIRLGVTGSWGALPEELIDRDARTSRAADVLLHRISQRDGVDEYAFWDVWDWFEDVGGPVRDFGRRMEAVDRYAVARMRGNDARLPRIGGCFVVRATTRNRELIRDHRHFFEARFPGSSHQWLTALTNPGTEMPRQPALIWVAVNGDRLFPSRLG